MDDYPLNDPLNDPLNNPLNDPLNEHINKPWPVQDLVAMTQAEINQGKIREIYRDWGWHD